MLVPLRHPAHGVGRFRALNSLRRDFEHPAQNKRDRQTDNDEQDNQANDPVRNIENWKNLRDSLRERPARDDVGDGDLVNIAPLSSTKKFPEFIRARHLPRKFACKPVDVDL